jgi:hypothetical protein
MYWACAVCVVLVAGLLVARQAQTNAPREIGYDELLKLLEKPQGLYSSTFASRTKSRSPGPSKAH